MAQYKSIHERRTKESNRSHRTARRCRRPRARSRKVSCWLAVVWAVTTQVMERMGTSSHKQQRQRKASICPSILFSKRTTRPTAPLALSGWRLVGCSHLEFGGLRSISRQLHFGEVSVAAAGAAEPQGQARRRPRRAGSDERDGVRSTCGGAPFPASTEAPPVACRASFFGCAIDYSGRDSDGMGSCHGTSDASSVAACCVPAAPDPTTDGPNNNPTTPTHPHTQLACERNPPSLQEPPQRRQWRRTVRPSSHPSR